MDFKSPIAGRYVRIVAIIALLLGLSDAARLLGINSATESPIASDAGGIARSPTKNIAARTRPTSAIAPNTMMASVTTRRPRVGDGVAIRCTLPVKELPV